MEVQATREEAPQGRAEERQKQGHAESGHPNAFLTARKYPSTSLPQVSRPGAENSQTLAVGCGLE